MILETQSGLVVYVACPAGLAATNRLNRNSIVSDVRLRRRDRIIDRRQHRMASLQRIQSRSNYLTHWDDCVNGANVLLRAALKMAEG